jgi:hypothetical protein
MYFEGIKNYINLGNLEVEDINTHLNEQMVEQEATILEKFDKVNKDFNTIKSEIANKPISNKLKENRIVMIVGCEIERLIFAQSFYLQEVVSIGVLVEVEPILQGKILDACRNIYATIENYCSFERYDYSHILIKLYRK